MKRILLPIIALLMIFVSCEDDSRDIITGGGSVSAEDQAVEVSLKSSLYNTNTSTFSDVEVVELDLVIVNSEGYYQYTRTAYSSAYAKYRSTLKIENNIDIYFFANCSALLADSTSWEGRLWKDIEKELILTETDTTIAVNNTLKTVLPMFGQLKNVNVSEHNINNFSVELMRAVASVNIYFDIEDTDGNADFEPTVAYIYYGADQGYITVDKANYLYDENTPDKLIGIKRAVTPSTMRTTRKLEAEPNTGMHFVNSFFIFDNGTTEDETVHPDNKRTRLVIGGYFKNATAPTYFPLDFIKTGQDELLTITRNIQYNLFITAVKGEGYPDPDIAVENAPVNLDYDVIQWNENNDHDIAVDGPDYLSINKKSVFLAKKAQSKATISLTGTYTADRITLTLPDSSLNGTPTIISNGVKNDRFQVEMVSNGTVHILTVTALDNYSTLDPAFNKETLRIDAGRVGFDVSIEQLSSGGWNDGGTSHVDF